MRTLVALGCLLACAFGMTIIEPSLFDLDFEEGSEALLVEVDGNASNSTNGTDSGLNMTIVAANLTFIGRRTGNFTINDDYVISIAGLGEIGTAKRTMNVRPLPSPQFPMTIVLDHNFAISLSGPSALGGLDDRFKLHKVHFRAHDAECESSVCSIFSRRTGFEWHLIPGYIPGFTAQLSNSPVFDETPLRIALLGSRTGLFEIGWQTVIPSESEVLDPCDPRIILRHDNLLSVAGDDVDDGFDEEEVEEEIEEEEAEVPPEPVPLGLDVSEIPQEALQGTLVCVQHPENAYSEQCVLKESAQTWETETKRE
jgi:hypothetical protein